MGDDDLIRRGDAARAVALCSAESDSPNAHFVCRQAVNAIAALPAVSAPHPYSLRPDLQKIVDNAKNAPQWDTERDRLAPLDDREGFLAWLDSLPKEPNDTLKAAYAAYKATVKPAPDVAELVEAAGELADAFAKQIGDRKHSAWPVIRRVRAALARIGGQ